MQPTARTAASLPTMTHSQPFFDATVEAWDETMGVNLKGIYFLSQVVARVMTAQKAGKIINISSVVGHTGNAGQIPYTMEKAALDAFTRSLAQELRGRNILVNSVAPGFIDTEMTKEER